MMVPRMTQGGVWVMVPKGTGQVFVYDTELHAQGDVTSAEEIRFTHVDTESVTR